MRDTTKLVNANLLSTSYNILQQPKIATIGDRDPTTGLYESKQGGTILSRKISNAATNPDQPALVRGGTKAVATVDLKNASVNSGVGNFVSSGAGDLNKNLWSRDVLGDPVADVPAFYWFGSIEDSADRIEVTPSDYEHYNDMAFGNVFPRSNESIIKTGIGKQIEVIAGAGGRLTIQLSYFGNLINQLFSVTGETEVWAKVPGTIKAHRVITDVNRTGFGSGVSGAPPDPRNISITVVRGNPGDRSGPSVPNGNFHRLSFNVGSPGAFTPITDLPFYYAITNYPTTIPIAPDLPIHLVNFV